MRGSKDDFYRPSRVKKKNQTVLLRKERRGKLGEVILVPTSTVHTITWFNNGSGIMASLKLYSRSCPSIIETDLSNAQASRQSHMAIPLDRFFFDRQP